MKTWCWILLYSQTLFFPPDWVTPEQAQSKRTEIAQLILSLQKKRSHAKDFDKSKDTKNIDSQNINIKTNPTSSNNKKGSTKDDDMGEAKEAQDHV